MHGTRSSRRCFLKLLRNWQRRSLCETTGGNRQPTTTITGSSGGGGGGGGNKEKVPNVRDLEAYRDLDKLNFTKAAKILFSDPPKKKKFGIDFHLVQFFFACLPPLAVFLVAQYARYKMKKMDAELELKKKAEEEKAKEIEDNAARQRMESNPELLKVKERLEALEVTVKEIVVETKKQTGDHMRRFPDASMDNKDRTTYNPKTQQNDPKQTTPSSGTQEKNELAVPADAHLQNQKGKTT